MAVPNERIANYGFNPNLSYSVISFTSKGGLELRASFGTVEERSKIPLRAEGTFELSSVQMREVISHVLISTTNTTYHTTTLQGRHRFGFYSTYNFRVDSKTEGFISVSQWDKRFYPENRGYDYSPLHLILQKTESDGHVSFVNAGNDLLIQPLLIVPATLTLKSASSLETTPCLWQETGRPMISASIFLSMAVSVST